MSLCDLVLPWCSKNALCPEMPSGHSDYFQFCLVLWIVMNIFCLTLLHVCKVVLAITYMSLCVCVCVCVCMCDELYGTCICVVIVSSHLHIGHVPRMQTNLWEWAIASIIWENLALSGHCVHACMHACVREPVYQYMHQLACVRVFIISCHDLVTTRLLLRILKF